MHTFRAQCSPLLDYRAHGGDTSTRSDAYNWSVPVRRKVNETLLYSNVQRIAWSMRFNMECAISAEAQTWLQGRKIRCCDPSPGKL